MITKDVAEYLSRVHERKLESVTELSESGKGISLVNDERQMYNFDKITEMISGKREAPNSADAMLVTNRQILFTEFKSGFVKKINKRNFDYKRMDCPDKPSIICRPYANLFIENQNMENEQLLDSLKLKAIESYVTLEKQILPLCEEKIIGKALRCVFGVVIDVPNDKEEDILNELAEVKDDESENTIAQIRQSLKRLSGNKCTNGETYLYDEIKVFSPYEFKKYLDGIAV